MTQTQHLTSASPDTPIAAEPAVAVDEATGGGRVSRRALLKAGAGGAAALGFYSALSAAPDLSRQGLLSKDGVFGAASEAIADSIYTEVFPTTPLVLEPFKDSLVIPPVLAPDTPTPVEITEDTAQTNLSFDDAGTTFQKHQIPQKFKDANGLPKALVYTIPLRVAGHSFTSSRVLPIDSNGNPTQSSDAAGNKFPAGTARDLPPSAIYGFNGTFPGSRINAEYGQPVLVRFDNHLDENPLNLPRGDFGSPDQTFLTHLHNGHTAPESDGNPHYFFQKFQNRTDPRGANEARLNKPVTGYPPGYHVDNLYLNWPAAGDETEKQSFFWFHDHRMDQTGSNVFKGMVGLYPIYDPVLDPGDETKGLGLPGVRTDNPDGSFSVDYDIPLAFYDTRLDDGVTVHHDIHDGEFVDVDKPGHPPIPGNKAHPEWWGRTFYKHFPNHGFVGDLFTVNGTAFPVLEVKRRKYRFRFLDASISRIYEFKLMKSAGGPKAAKDLGLSGPELQGQYRIPDGQQCMKWLQVASDGGLLPKPLVRDSFELWPAKRREFIVDFTQYQDGSPTTKGDVIYLTNVMKMTTGRMWDSSSRFSPDPNYKIPMIKIVIGGDAADNSKVTAQTTKLRDLPKMKVTPGDPNGAFQKAMDNRLIFEVQRGSGGGEVEWLINGKPFDPKAPLTSLKNPAGKTPPAAQPQDSYALWEIRNGGGGWVHPFHLHMEEHRTVMRNGRLMIDKDGNQLPDTGHPDDGSREDLVALDPSESTIIYRSFRDFTGNYVAHCHNLAHEDHAMMFGWSIT